MVTLFTSLEHTYDNFFKILLCYAFYSVCLEFMPKGITDWLSMVWRRVRITSTLTLRVVKGRKGKPVAGGMTWATLFLGDMNKGT
jgi:hypothetical protein